MKEKLKKVIGRSQEAVEIAGVRYQGGRSPAVRLWTFWKRKPLGFIGAVLMIFFIALAFLAPVIAPFSPGEFAGGRLKSPSSEFLLGTNNLGQDVLSRTIYGAQVSIAVGLSATIIAIAAGTLIGVVAGYFGGWVDLIAQRALEVIASVPPIILALAIVSVLGQPRSFSSNPLSIAWDLKTVGVAIGIAYVFDTVRIIRAAVIKERSLAYVEAARSIGVSTPRLLWRHILPNVMPYIIVIFSTIIGGVILAEASLSFLGYGVASGTPSWGLDLASSNRAYFTIAPWLIFGPGLALSLVVLGYNLLGDALRDILDPRLRDSR